MPKKTQKPKRDKQQDKQKRVADEIQVILLKNKMAILPYLDNNELGIVPRVRLIDTTKQETNANDTTDKGEVETDADSDGAVQSEQS